MNNAVNKALSQQKPQQKPQEKSQEITVVADGGASGSRFAIFNREGVRVAETKGPPASLSLGTAATCEAIKAGISQLGEQYYNNGQWRPLHITLGLAGAEQQQQRRQFQQQLKPTVACNIVTDGYAHLLGVASGRPAICLSLGTGSVVHWQDGDKQGFAGGWGFPVADEASGAWLGRALVNAWLWTIDCGVSGFGDSDNRNASGRQPEVGQSLSEQMPDLTLPGPSLIAALEQRIGNNRSDIQHWTINAVSTDYASLVDLLVVADMAGDSFAGTIKSKGTNACLQLLALCPTGLPVYIAGGLAPFYLDNLQQQLGDRIKAAEGDALDGLHLMATNPLS